MSGPRVILASGSVHRRALLERLQLEFDVLAPDVDESAVAGEQAAALASRLARSKASAVAARQAAAAASGAVVIGSDQVAECAGRRLGKPGTREAAVRQLALVSDREVRFHTAVHVRHSVTGAHAEHVDLTSVRFRPLSRATIEAYLDREPALDCAGAFKSEGLGITLVQAMQTDDPTALIGLPLIWLCQTLRDFGLALPAAPAA